MEPPFVERWSHHPGSSVTRTPHLDSSGERFPSTTTRFLWSLFVYFCWKASLGVCVCESHSVPKSICLVSGSFHVYFLDKQGTGAP